MHTHFEPEHSSLDEGDSFIRTDLVRKSLRALKETSFSPINHFSNCNLLVILCVVLVTACVLVLLPVLAMLAGGEQHHILCVVDVM